MDGFQLGKVMEKKNPPSINNIVSLQDELQENWIQLKNLLREGLALGSKDWALMEENNIHTKCWEQIGRTKELSPKDQGSESSQQQNGSRASSHSVRKILFVSFSTNSKQECW